MQDKMAITFIISDNNTVVIQENGYVVVTQPVSPITGEPFASVEESTAWAEAHIAERESWYGNPPIVEESPTE